MSTGDEEAGLVERLDRVRERIARAAQRAGRDPASVTLVGVAKRHPAERVAAAVAGGLTHVGESFAQELREKAPQVAALLGERGLPAPHWHFVGRLQRNKARFVVPLVDCIESLDRASLAVELERRASALDRLLDVLLQVNLSGEAQKGGVREEELPALLRTVAAQPHLRLAGLMTVPAASPDPEAARPLFARLRALRERLCAEPGGDTLQELSMGMSADFEVAVEEGATIVRVGTDLFGPRET